MMSATTGYERFLFRFTVICWLICDVLVIISAIMLFPGYRLITNASTVTANEWLRRLELPFIVVTAACFLINFVSGKLKPFTIAGMILTCLTLPVHAYLVSLPDILIAPNITPAFVFLLSSYSITAMLSDLFLSDKKTNHPIVKPLFIIVMILSCIISVILVISSFSGHVLAQTVSFLFFTFPYTFILSLLLSLNRFVKFFGKSSCLLIRMLSVLLPAYTVIRLFVPDFSNTLISIFLLCILILTVIFQVLDRHSHKN